MHILLLNDDVLGPTARGGAATVVDCFRRGYTEAGHRTTVLTTHHDADGGPERRWSDTHGEILSLRVDGSLKGRHRRCVARTPVEEWVRVWARRLAPDVVHAHNVHSYLTYRSLAVAREATDRVFLTAHDSFLASFARVGGPRYEAALREGQPYRMRWWEHAGIIGREYWPFRNAAIRRILRSSVQSVIPVSNALRAFLEANDIRCTPAIHNAAPDLEDIGVVDIRAFKEHWRIDGPAVIYGGRVSGDKGAGAFLAAAQRVLADVPTACFVIAGDADRLAPWLQDCPHSVRERVRVTGWLQGREFDVAVFASDVLVVPSLYLDPLPTMTLWAMAAGKPVVGTCFGGTPELIIEGKTGFVVNPHDADALAKPIAELLQHPDRARAMGQEAQRVARERHALPMVIEQYLDRFSRPVEDRR